MQITDIISITELSRLLGKSRPTVYKYVSDFESGNERALPPSVRKLFREIAAENMPRREIYAYCDHWFGDEPTVSVRKAAHVTLKDVIALLKKYEASLDLTRVKDFIEKEIQK